MFEEEEKNLKEEEKDFEEEDAGEESAKEEPGIVTRAPNEDKRTGLDLDEKAQEAQENEKQWYVVNTYAGRERTVADNLETRKVSMNQENNIFRIVVAEREEEVIDKKTNRPVVKKDGTVKTKTINLYPGYIFVEAIMSDLAWYIIRNTPGVTGIVGSSGSGTKPFPIPKEDMLPILKQMNLVKPTVSTNYSVGEKVIITEGAFADSDAVITTVNAAEATAEVSVTFFGRPTTVTLPFSSLEKSEDSDK